MGVAQALTSKGDHTKRDIQIKARYLNKCKGYRVLLDFCVFCVTAFFVNFFMHSLTA